MKIHRMTIFLVITALVLVGLLGYGFSKRQNQATDESNVIRVADLPVVHALPFYVALEKGYFDEAGIEVERVKLDSPNLIIDAMLSGQVDLTSPSGALGITGVADTKQPGKLRIYMASGGDLEVANDAFLISNESTVSSIEDFHGKSIGILPGIQWRTITKHILAQHGLDSDADVEIVELAPALQAPALASGQIDVLLGIEPMPTIVKERGIGKELVHAPTAKEVANPFYPGAGIIRTEFAEQNPELTQKILGVFVKALADVRSNPEEMKQYYKNYTPLEDDLIPKAPVLKYRLYNELDDANTAAVQKFYDIFTTYDVVDGPINAQSLIYEP